MGYIIIKRTETTGEWLYGVQKEDVYDLLEVGNTLQKVGLNKKGTTAVIYDVLIQKYDGNKNHLKEVLENDK